MTDDNSGKGYGFQPHTVVIFSSAEEERMGFPVKFEDCEKMSGHCFERTAATLTSNPPQYPEYCKHCGATR
ncbi:hypothetical protein LCGC14_3117470, partial [marine sediment metagenome]